MAIVSPGVHTDLEVNLKPNLDTEQGLSHTVTHEVDLEVPPHLTDQEATLEAEAGAGIAEAEPAAGAAPTEVSIATGHPAGAGPGAAPMTPTAAPADPTPMTATTAGVVAAAAARGVTVTIGVEVTTGGPGVLGPMARTVKVTEVTLVTGAPVRAADTAEVSLYRLCPNCKYLVT